MFSPVDGWFSLVGSRSRANYAATILLAALLFGGIGALVAWFGLRDEVLLYTLLSFAAGAMVVFVLVSAQRFRDAGLPGLLALLIPIPVYFLHDDRILLGAILGLAYLGLSLIPSRAGVTRTATSSRPVQLR
jgi:uncharacterized membrane protein YhaH (DUF805 family)